MYYKIFSVFMITTLAFIFYGLGLRVNNQAFHPLLAAINASYQNQNKKKSKYPLLPYNNIISQAEERNKGRV